jgi:4-hydroxy-3-methylbut-2-enyl diphosphate reductase
VTAPPQTPRPHLADTHPTLPAQLTVCAPMRLEAAALRRNLPRDAVRHSGYGPRRAARTARRLNQAARPDGSVGVPRIVAGFCGGVAAGLNTGDVVVASEVHGPAGTVACPSAALIAGELRRRGLTVHVGPIVTSDHVVHGAERAKLAAAGALAVDMESAHLLTGAEGAPLAVVRVVLDTPERPLARLGTVGAVRAAGRVLAQVGPVLSDWARSARARTVLLASPRSFCAGVDRAIEIVEHALDKFGAPVYVRKQIVHNVHVVRDLERRGAIFVDELDEVPDGAHVIFSAHGVSPAVRDRAAQRGLAVIDATCPLVTKVHSEAKRLARRGDTVVFIGHAGHEETEGTLGEAPEQMVLVETVEDAAKIEATGHVSYLMQTTLAVDEAAGIASALRERFPDLEGPGVDDICYATTNRQEALRAISAESDVVIVIGSRNSSNSLRLVELAEREGTPAHLVDDAADIQLAWLAEAGTIGLTAGASAPPALVDEVIATLGGLGPVTATERRTTEESVKFTLPKELRGA